MKFLLPITLLAIVGVSAQSDDDSKCDAEYIVTRCLESETAKVSACRTTEYDCLCAAYEAVATCYNNCPHDPRASDAQSQVKIFCANASIYGTTTKTTKTASSGSSRTTVDAATTTSSSEGEDDKSSASTSVSSTATRSADNTSSTGGAAELALNVGGVLLAVAGVVAGVL
ncbi:hypothetical protein G7046_g6877 [Stylonectria norvegica]|nr:hypothetical protein G7046_g6877 [Stylonectria norvegica]